MAEMFRLEKDFTVGGLRCLVIAVPSGWRCGYVRLPDTMGYVVDLSTADDLFSDSVDKEITYIGRSPIGDDDSAVYIGVDFGDLFEDGIDEDIVNSFDTSKDFKMAWIASKGIRSGTCKSVAYVAELVTRLAYAVSAEAGN